MVERETREQAQERILVLQDELMKRLEAKPMYQELPWDMQDQLVQSLMPQLFDPKYEISKLLKDIQTEKFFIAQYNKMAILHPDESEQWAEGVELAKQSIQRDLEEIKRIKRGEFEWIVK